MSKSRKRPHQPPRFQIVNKDDGVYDVTFPSAGAATAQAMRWFPDQSQDEERTGKGWDIAVVGADR